jgi:hypothetical protein
VHFGGERWIEQIVRLQKLLDLSVEEFSGAPIPVITAFSAKPKMRT